MSPENAAPPSSGLLKERLDALDRKVDLLDSAMRERIDEFRSDMREDIGHLTSAIGSLSFVDQRVHDIEVAALREQIHLIERHAGERADELGRDIRERSEALEAMVTASEERVAAGEERRALNFRLAVGALGSSLLLPLLVGLVLWAVTNGGTP